MKLTPYGFGPRTKPRPIDPMNQAEALLANGQAIDLSREAAAHFPRGRVTIHQETYDRFVCWSSSAMRKHGIALDERQRLETLLSEAGNGASSDCPNQFWCRACDADAESTTPQRQCFTLDVFEARGQKTWLIRH